MDDRDVVIWKSPIGVCGSDIYIGLCCHSGMADGVGAVEVFEAIRISDFISVAQVLD